MNLSESLTTLASELGAALKTVRDERALEELRVRVLGRSGKITEIRRGIGALPPDERPNAGKVINAAVERMESALASATRQLGNAQVEAQLSRTIDVTLPQPAGARSVRSIRSARRVMRTSRVFHPLGFVGAARTRDRNRRVNNFDALNIPPDHPAREGLRLVLLAPRSRAAHAHLADADARDAANPVRRSRSSCPAKRTAAMRSTRATSISSTKSKD